MPPTTLSLRRHDPSSYNNSTSLNSPGALAADGLDNASTLPSEELGSSPRHRSKHTVGLQGARVSHRRTRRHPKTRALPFNHPPVPHSMAHQTRFHHPCAPVLLNLGLFHSHKQIEGSTYICRPPNNSTKSSNLPPPTKSTLTNGISTAARIPFHCCDRC
jgi:hypothetical protein